MLYIGVMIDLAERGAEKALSALPFLTIYGSKEDKLIGVIEVQDLEEWKRVNEILLNIPGFLGLSILSSFQEDREGSS
ncbi:hypothetical protein THC_1379 [Caldimicrobium thiodismutans]|jgi:nitrate reductase NapAB chaperone NapD|uniref:Uncharacterized protein n=1 Tax=Caldimicrobium thiodismutans TaxID=1653476 RepID=A0A0U5AS43_9BACT|nr:hypothetical protein [Caldimicrobium thiodismutans]BAU23745.1 hypothetical protein THC_1379 [Caldimicrobium thiodismutans]